MVRPVLTRPGTNAPQRPRTARAPGLASGFAARALWWLCAMLPAPQASAFGAGVFGWIGPQLPKHRHVLANLRQVAPRASDAERAALARAVWRNLGAVMAEYPHLPTLVRERVELRFDPGVRELMRPGQAIVFCAGHIANWELIAAQIVALGLPLCAVHARLGNPSIERQLDRHRRRLGCSLIEKRGSARQLVAALQRGATVGLVADQRFDAGESVSFFDAPALTATTPARLALRCDAPLVPVRVERLPGARFRIHFLAPIPRPVDAPRQRDAARRMTEAFMQRLEAWIRVDPGSWLCTKRRWAKPRPIRVPARRAETPIEAGTGTGPGIGTGIGTGAGGHGA